ncbi:MAG: DUF2911 domain-containing protein [Flavobacteriaceae bacterium]
MKNILQITGLFLFTLLYTSNVSAQEFPKLDVSPMDLVIARDTDKSPLMRVIYSRPQKKDRVVFGNLVPFDQVWRTGANEATELEVYKSFQIGNETINPGTYTLYTIPGEDMWTVIINKETNTWGAYSYKEELDALRIEVPSKNAAATIETLSMAFKPTDDGLSLMIGWDDRFVEVPFKRAN